MPVSPQDFELYSRMTGAPMPTDAMSRMQMAPDVYNFTKSFARKPNLFEKTGNLVKNIGRGAVMALGAPLVAASVAEEARMQEQLRNQADKAESDSVTMENPTEEVADTPAMAKIRLQMEADAVKHKQKLELQDRMDARALGKSTGVSGVVQTDLNPAQKSGPKPIGKTPDGQLLYDAADLSTQEPTTADTYGQDYLPNQTSSNIVDRKISQGSQIADSTPNVAEVLSESQDSRPASLYGTNPLNVPRLMSEDVGTMTSPEFISKFRKKRGLDKALKGVFKLGQQEEELVDDNTIVESGSPLNDHPDVKDVSGGEEPNPRMGTNTSPTENLNDYYKEMRRMDAMERNKEVVDEVVNQYKNLSPSERQLMLGTEEIDSPNEMQGRITAAEESTNKLIDVVKAMGGEPSKEQKIEADQANSRILQKTAAKNRLKGRINEKFYPTDVARTDIQVGGMVDRKTGLGKSVGISYTPMNGDTKVGFNVMNDPTKPREVSTFDFVVPPETMESLQSQKEEDLGSKTFGKLFNIARQKKQGFSGMEM